MVGDPYKTLAFFQTTCRIVLARGITHPEQKTGHWDEDSTPLFIILVQHLRILCLDKAVKRWSDTLNAFEKQFFSEVKAITEREELESRSCIAVFDIADKLEMSALLPQKNVFSNTQSM
jgi:hypothetical protein